MDLRETSLGFYRAWHIALGVRHGMFLALRDAPLDVPTLARELGHDANALTRWCEGAWALDLLTRDRTDRYRLAPSHRASLGEPTSTEYLGHHFEYLAQKSLTFGALDTLLAGERPQVDLAEVYAIATRYDHQASFAALPGALGEALAEGLDVLDLGAGQGGWTREAIRRYPRSRFAAADIDTTALNGLAGARVLDARSLPRAAFDLVYMGEVLAATRDPLRVLKLAHRSLRPGGQLLALEGLRPSLRRAPRDWGERLVLAMALDFSTDGSTFLSRSELRRALDEAEFRRVRIEDLGGSLFRIHARKPQTARGG